VRQVRHLHAVALVRFLRAVAQVRHLHAVALVRLLQTPSLAKPSPFSLAPCLSLKARKSAAKNWMSANPREELDERHPDPNPRGPPPPPLPPELRGETVLWPTQEAKTPFPRAV
jgi:hypothetical protein